jgi:hypothetical protein
MENLNTQNDLLDFHQQLQMMPHKRLVKYHGLNGYKKRVYHHALSFIAVFSAQQLSNLLNFLDFDESGYTVTLDRLVIQGAVKHVLDDDSVHAHNLHIQLDEALTAAFTSVEGHLSADTMRDVLASTLRVQRLKALIAA